MEGEDTTYSPSSRASHSGLWCILQVYKGVRKGHSYHESHWNGRCERTKLIHCHDSENNTRKIFLIILAWNTRANVGAYKKSSHFTFLISVLHFTLTINSQQLTPRERKAVTWIGDRNDLHCMVEHAREGTCMFFLRFN